MADSLTLGGTIELLGGGIASDYPGCEGAIFRLGREFDMSAPQMSTEMVAGLLLDGERATGLRASNRVPAIPVVVIVPNTGDAAADRTKLAAARELLLRTVGQDNWQMIWQRDGGLPLVLDCMALSAITVEHSIIYQRNLCSLVEVTFSALPYGKSDASEDLAFPAPSVQWTPPPSPVSVDDYSSVSTSTQSGSWSQINTAATGSNSAFWVPATNVGAIYTHTLGAAKNLTGQQKLAFWLGLTRLYQWKEGAVTYKIKLTDNGGQTLSFGGHRWCKSGPQWSGTGSPKPFWNLITGTLPYSSAFNYSNVASYSITLWNRTTSNGAKRIDCNVYVNALIAYSAVAGTPTTRSGFYTLGDAIGTARAPLSVQIQPAPGVAQTMQEFTTAGAFTFTPPAGVSTVQCWAWGPGGGSGGGNSNNGGAGGAGGELAADLALAVTPLVVHNGVVGAAGTAGAVNGDGGTGSNTTFTGNAKTVTAHAGAGGKKASTLGVRAPGGTGSTNPIHYPGGDGYDAGQYRPFGQGGGSSAGPNSAGNDASGHYGASGPYDAGPGGDGGSTGNPGGSPAVGPGGGAGGGASPSQAGAAGKAGKVRIIYGSAAGTALNSTLIHQPGPTAPDLLVPVVAVGNGADAPDGRDYNVPIQGNLQARYNGTYAVYLIGSTWNTPNAARNLTVTLVQYAYSGAAARTQSLVRNNVVPSTDITNFIVEMGYVTLPLDAIPPGNVEAYFAGRVLSSNASDRFLDIILCDTMGSTVIYNDPGSGQANIWVAEPGLDYGLGRVLGSVTDTDRAASIMRFSKYSGGPLSVTPGGNSRLLVYARAGAPAVKASYYPRWWQDRLS